MVTESATVAPHTAERVRRLAQLRALLGWFGVGILALGVGIVLADLAFPEPTVLRLPLMLIILVGVGLLVARHRRTRVSGSSARPAHRFAAASPES